MRGKPFVFCDISKTYKVYDINLSLRKKEEVTTQVTSSFSIYYVAKVLSCKTLCSGTCLKMTTANPATEGYRTFANSQV